MSVVMNYAQFLKMRTWNFGHKLFLQNISTAEHALFAGHSKWANIRHIKATKDGQKAALFTKISRQIRLAIQDGGSADPLLNTQLKSVIDDALRKNMPMSTIKNNIQKSVQNKNELRRYKLDLRYRQKVFAVCVIYTDNYAGVKIDMATVLRKSGATILDASHIFEEIGLIQAVFHKSRLHPGNDLQDLVMEDAIEFDAADVEIVDKENGIVNFICRPFDILPLRKRIEAKGYITDNTEHIYVPRKKTFNLEERMNNVKKLIIDKAAEKSCYDWLGKQVVFEITRLKNERIQRDAVWSIQQILRKSSIEDAKAEAQTSCSFSTPPPESSFTPLHPCRTSSSASSEFCHTPECNSQSSILSTNTDILQQSLIGVLDDEDF